MIVCCFFPDPVITVLGAAQPPQMKILHYLIDKLHFLSGLYKAGRVEWFLFLPAHLARVSTFELEHSIRYRLAVHTVKIQIHLCIHTV